jgi:SAM-dependent methyltransferase
MHVEAREGIKTMVELSGLEYYELKPPVRWDAEIRILDALDLGGADVNGTARDLVDAVRQCHWTVADIEPGPGVAWVFDATKDVEQANRSQWDVVLCTEVLEHVREWPSILYSIHNLLKPGGYAFISCASIGRAPHGARGAARPAPGEWYENVPDVTLDTAIHALEFSDWHVSYRPAPGDAYAWARK